MNGIGRVSRICVRGAEGAETFTCGAETGFHAEVEAIEVCDGCEGRDEGGTGEPKSSG